MRVCVCLGGGGGGRGGRLALGIGLGLGMYRGLRGLWRGFRSSFGGVVVVTFLGVRLSCMGGMSERGL